MAPVVAFWKRKPDDDDDDDDKDESPPKSTTTSKSKPTATAKPKGAVKADDDDDDDDDDDKSHSSTTATATKTTSTSSATTSVTSSVTSSATSTAANKPRPTLSTALFNKHKHDKAYAGTLAGAIIGALLLFALCAVVIFFLVKRHRKMRDSAPDTGSAPSPPAPGTRTMAMRAPEPRFAPDTPEAEKGYHIDKYDQDGYRHDEYNPGDLAYHRESDDYYNRRDHDDDQYEHRNPHSPDSDYDEDGLPVRHPEPLRPTSARPVSARPDTRLDPLPFQDSYAPPINIDDKLDTPGWGPGSAMPAERPRSRGPPERPISRGPPPERPVSRGPPERPLSRNMSRDDTYYGVGRGQR